MHDCLFDPRWGLPDAYPVVLLPSEWAHASGRPALNRPSSEVLVRVDVADPRATAEVAYGSSTADHDSAVRAARDRLDPVLASTLREPPPTSEEITRGVGRLAWRYRRYGAPSARRIGGWLSESSRPLAGADRGWAELDAVEACVDGWLADPAKTFVAEEIAEFLGEVLYATAPESRLTVRADGEPGIALQNGQEIDLLALARQRIKRGWPALPSVLINLGGS